MTLDLYALARMSYRCEFCGEPAGSRCIVAKTDKPTKDGDHMVRSDALREAYGDGWKEGVADAESRARHVAERADALPSGYEPGRRELDGPLDDGIQHRFAIDFDDGSEEVTAGLPTVKV